MQVRSLIIAIVILMVTAGAAWAEFEELSFANDGLVRVVSGTINILKTTKLLAGGAKLIDQPSVEVMVEIEHKGNLMTLVPSDFDIKTIDTVTKGKELQTRIELRSRDADLPLLVYVDYWRDPKKQYQQKSINVPACKALTGTILKRITIDSIQFSDAIQPIALAESGFVNETKNSIAAFEPKSSKGICFDFPSGKAEINRWKNLIAYEEMNVPLETGYTTGRISLGVISGKPDAMFKSYRQMLLETRYPILANDPKFAALRKRFGTCFAACQYLPDDGHVNAEGHITDNKGFILLFNTGSEASNVSLPLSNPGLSLSGDLKLSDWTSLDKSTDMGVKKTEDKIEIEVPAKGYRIIGVNIDA